MTALLKSLFDRKTEMTAKDFAHLDEQKSALHGRMQQLLKSSQIGTSQRPTTDRFGRPLH